MRLIVASGFPRWRERSSFSTRGQRARAILKRFIELYPGRRFPSPEQVVATPLARLRKVGLSKPKALYIQGLAAISSRRR